MKRHSRSPRKTQSIALQVERPVIDWVWDGAREKYFLHLPGTPEDVFDVLSPEEMKSKLLHIRELGFPLEENIKNMSGRQHPLNHLF